MGQPQRSMRVLGVLTCAVLLVAAAPAVARQFRPRIGGALGLIPLRGAQSASEALTIPLVYHGGTVMHGVTVHTLYWAPPGYAFDGPPPNASGGYTSVIDGFLRDTAADSGAASNVFSLLGQYPDATGAAGYEVRFDPTVDSITDATPYPDGGHGCISAAGAATCVTDAALQAEITQVIRSRAPTATGLHDLWLIMLPPGVDTCVSAGSCATNAYAGYHSLFDTPGGPVIYAAIPDPTLELVPPAGSDPQGNPEAENAVDTLAHEVMEAITDPEGAGWMDPNGFEVGDRCETGPQVGAPLGFAPDGAPYNQLIAGHQYLIQAMWSNLASGCIARSPDTAGAAALPAVTLTQYSPTLTGRDPSGRPGGRVSAVLLRAGQLVGLGATRTVARGHFRLTLRGSDGRPTAVGDDREQVGVQLGGHALVIQTGDGGDPFAAAGWTGWFDLDHGALVGRRAVAIAPCSQVGVLTLRRDGRPQGAPIDQCQTGTGVAIVPTAPIGRATRLMFDSEDNRASSAAFPAGGLVTLRVGLGEPGAVLSLSNPLIALSTTAEPTCAADLYQGRASCTGLVPHAGYRLGLRGRSIAVRASVDGTATLPARLGPLRGGDALALRGAGGRLLTLLHVAHLRVDLTAGATRVAHGHCEPGEFVGPPVSAPPTGPSIGVPGVAGRGLICPLTGDAAGLPVSSLEQSDDRSGGLTRTEVPQILGTVPAQDATLYGPFRALAQTGFAGGGSTARDRVALRITRAGGQRTVFAAGNVHTAAGVRVSALRPGGYTAVWTLHDRNGDTRTLRTVFVEV